MRYLVLLDRSEQVLVALGIHVIRPDKHPLLPGGNGKRPYARHDVAHDLAGLEESD